MWERVIKIIRMIFAVIEKVCEWLSMVMLVTMIAITSYQIVMRYVFNNSPSWSEEVSLLLIVWFGILSIPIGVKYHLHIGIEFLFNLFPQPIQRIGFQIIFLLIAGFGLVMVISGTELVQFMMMSTLPATKLPSAVEYAVIPISGLMVVYNALENLFMPFEKLQYNIKQARGI
jgi:TRAP-type C4-dicarboxylate transport system permease small subunit